MKYTNSQVKEYLRLTQEKEISQLKKKEQEDRESGTYTVKKTQKETLSQVENLTFTFTLPVFEDMDKISDKHWEQLEEWVTMMYYDQDELQIFKIAKA